MIVTEFPNGHQPRVGTGQRPAPPTTGSGVSTAGLARSVADPIASTLAAAADAVEAMAARINANVGALAALTARVAALEAANARRERESRPRAFLAD